MDETELAVVVGTRSEAVSLAPVVRMLRRTSGIRPLVVATGSHQVLDPVLRPLGVRPDVDLVLADRAAPIRRQAAEVIERLGELLACRRPAAVLVHGDSTTAFGGALVAFSEGIPVAHLGAGLRTGVLDEPFPEEANRRLIAPLASWHLAPTANAAANLLAEGIDPRAVTITGATGIDSLYWAVDLNRGRSAFGGPDEASSDGAGARGGGGPDRVDGARGRGDRRPRLLACLRPREGRPLRCPGLAGALRRVVADGVDVVVVLPTDPDPGLVADLAEISQPGPVRVVESLEYLDFVATLRACDLVLTDSGAVEEEAPSLGKPVLVARPVTDRPEGLTAGRSRLIGPDPQDLVQDCRALLATADHGDGGAQRGAGPYGDGPYGDGRSAARVVATLVGALSRPRPGQGDRPALPVRPTRAAQPLVPGADLVPLP